MRIEAYVGARAVVFDDAGKVLLVQHREAGRDVWVPPGGGLEPGETLVQCVIREVQEETGIEASVERFLFLDEAHSDGVLSLGVWFIGKVVGGSLALGTDPELGDAQILSDCRFVAPQEFASLGAVYPEAPFWDSVWRLRCGESPDLKSFALSVRDEVSGDFVRTGWL